MSGLVAIPTSMQPRISRSGKRLWSKAQKHFIVSETMKAGATVSKVSRQYDINANQIFYWIKRAGREGQKIVPVGVIGAPAAAGLRPQPVVPKLIEIELQNGVKVRIDDEVRMPMLKNVLEILRSLA